MLRVLLLSACLAVPAAAQCPDLLRTFYGGGATAIAGDVDADGFADVLTQTSSNSVALYSGRTGARLASWSGDSSQDKFGFDLDGIGDIDGDGHADFAIGATFAGPGLATGRVYVYSGQTLERRFIWTGTDRDHFGGTVAGAGDVDGDGTPDVLVGTSRTDGGPTGEYVRIYSGATGAIVREWSIPGGGFGRAADGAGDVDGDGFADVVIGAAGAATTTAGNGIVRVFSGRTSELLYAWSADFSNQAFGVDVAGAGDVDADGFADVIVGTSNSSPISIPMAYVYSGRTGELLRPFRNHNTGDFYFGTAVDGAGDVDGDGFADLVIGAYGAFPPNSNSSFGAVYVYSGRTGAELGRRYGNGSFDGLGSTVAGGGDIDGDGLADVVAAAYSQNETVGLAFASCAPVAGEPEPNQSASLTVSPNPARGAARVAFVLAAPGPVRLTVLDARGRTVAVLADGPMGAGPHSAAFDGLGLAPGVYAVRLDAGVEARTHIVTVVR